MPSPTSSLASRLSDQNCVSIRPTYLSHACYIPHTTNPKWSFLKYRASILFGYDAAFSWLPARPSALAPASSSPNKMLPLYNKEYNLWSSSVYNSLQPHVTSSK
jgi:hypothetical protein